MITKLREPGMPMREWADMLEMELRAAHHLIGELRDALQDIAERLESASAEVDCFNVYQSRDVARDALALIRSS